MTCLCIELIAIRLNQNGVPEILLNTLSLVIIQVSYHLDAFNLIYLKIFDRENEFHTKNLSKVWDRQMFIEKLGGSNNFFTINSDSYGWLINFINHVKIRKIFFFLILCFNYHFHFSLD
jgi:hypothetical protein